MPFVGFRCPAQKAPVKPDVCLTCATKNTARSCHYPAWLISCLVVDNEHESFGPTTLLGCHRAAALRHKHPYCIDPGESWVMVRGSALHRFVATSPSIEGVLREEPFERVVELGGDRNVVVRGIVDEFNTNTGHLVDYKTVSYITPTMIESGKPEWAAQLSIYSWLIFPQYRVNSAEIVMVDPYSIIRKPYKLASLQATEKLVTNAVTTLWLAYYDDILPPVLPSSQQWRCVRCNVREACTEEALSAGQTPPSPRKNSKIIPYKKIA